LLGIGKGSRRCGEEGWVEGRVKGTHDGKVAADSVMGQEVVMGQVGEQRGGTAGK